MAGPGYVAYRVVCAPALEDELIARLWERGTAGVEHQKDGSLLAYFPAGTRLDAEGLGDDVRVEAVPVPEVDWVARFKEGFRAFDAGRFRIVPVWDAAAPDARTLIVDPGRAFGTGTHETTRLCLDALGRLADGPGLGRVIDIGTGSGLLAIAALRLGATTAVGVDNDPEAMPAASLHAKLNRVTLPVFVGDGGQALRAGVFDTVLANLMAPLLLDKKSELQRLRSPRGRLVLSGLLLEDLELIRQAYADLGTLAEMRQGEWAALIVG